MLMEADLPDDVDALRAIVLEQTREIDSLRALQAEVERLRAIIEALQRHRFGRRSEQLDPDQLQLGLEDAETALAQAEVASEARTGRSGEARPRKTNRGSLPAHLERIEQVVDVEEKTCPCCGGALHRIGEDVAERLDVVPTTFRVLVTRRPRYGCRSCESAVVQAPAPARIVEGGIPTEALIAQVLVAKYADHLPLYRQAQIYARQGVQLDRSTLAALRQAQEGRPGSMVYAAVARSRAGRAATIGTPLRRRDHRTGARSGAREDQDRSALGLRPR